MLLALWALVLVGGAPLPADQALCGAGASHAAHHDCLACSACCAVPAALPAVAPGMPAPRIAVRLAAATDARPAPGRSAPAPFRARAPPRLA